MYQDFMTFIHSILSHSSEAESLLPDSFREHIPIDSFMNFFSELNSSVKLLGAVITLILALLLCFFGYKFARIFMSITGFLAGAVIGLTVSYKFFDLTGPLVILCTLAAGIIIALLSFHIYMAGLFILCFILAFMAAASLLPFTGDIQFFLATLTGFIIGSLSLKFIRPVMILSSALVGHSSRPDRSHKRPHGFYDLIPCQRRTDHSGSLYPGYHRAVPDHQKSRKEGTEKEGRIII